MIKLPRHIFIQNKIKNDLIINRRSIRFYIDQKYLIKKSNIEIVLSKYLIFSDEYCKCVFCGFLRMLTEVTIKIDNDYVLFINEKFKLESRICFESVNPGCPKSNYNRNSEKYMRIVYSKDVAEQKINKQKSIAIGRYTEEWFINKYGDIEGKMKYNERIQKISRSSTKEGYIEKYGEIEGLNKWNNFINSISIKRGLNFYIDKYGEEIGKEKYQKEMNHIKSLNNIDTYIKKYGKIEGEKIWKRRYANLNCFINKYGEEEGKIKYNIYCKKKTVTLENLQTKYGEEEGNKRFDHFRNNCALTLNKMIELHGEVDGTRRYNEYREKLIGKCTLDWYIERYGEKEGKIKHEEFCKSSICSLEVMIKKYGEEEGRDRYDKWLSGVLSCCKGYSEISQKLFFDIIKNISKQYIYFYKLNKEHLLMDENNNHFFLLDFVNIKTKKCIEFNGDYWHANKEIYKENTFIERVGLIASEIWKRDEKRIKYIESRGFDVLTVWENDYTNNPNQTINRCLNFLNGETINV